MQNDRQRNSLILVFPKFTFGNNPKKPDPMALGAGISNFDKITQNRDSGYGKSR